jgi:N6-adenosine-specific RNA methylase IME4
MLRQLLRRRPPPGPGYRTIVADPPWDHGDGFVYMDPRPGGAGPYQRHLPYQVMTLEEICSLPVEELRPPAKVGAALFLWATNRHLPNAFAVIDAWGFSYRQTVVWQKKDPMPTAGSVAPPSEFLLVARFGSHRWHGPRWPASVIVAPSCEHSRKPDVFQDYIEQISPGPYLELFARRQRIGWDTWGNECLEHVQLAAPEPERV